MSVASSTDFQVRNEVIMIVENDPTIRGEIQRSLEVLGFPVVDAGDAAEARDLYSFLDPVIRLVIIEPTIPGENGNSIRDFLGHIRPDVEVLFLEERGAAAPGSSAGHGTRRRSLQKPVDREELLRAVHGILY